MTEQALADSRARPVRRKWLLWSGILSLIALSIGWYFHPLRGLPDVGEPPGVAAFRDREVPDADNAFTYYKAASERLVRCPADVGNDWASATTPARQWVDQNQEAVALFLEGSTRPDAQYIRPRTITVNTILPVTQNLRDLARVVLLEASRRRQEGDPASAWPYYHAVLRASRHSGRNGVPIERLVGAAIWDAATPPIESWAVDPRLDVATLKAALADVEAAEALTAPLSDQVIAEYLMFMQTIDDPRSGGPFSSFVTSLGVAPRPLLTIGNWSFTWDSVRNSGASLWIRGEPEKTKRLLKLTFANWLEYCDRPRVDRPRRTDVGGPRLFVPEPGAPPALHALSIQDLGRRYDSSILGTIFGVDLFDPLMDARSDQAGHSALEKEEANRMRLHDVLRREIAARERSPAT